jgi:hypothetical protein
MLNNPFSTPSRENLRAEREQIKAQIAQDRELIARSRANIAKAQKLFADSFDRLAENQKLKTRLIAEATRRTRFPLPVWFR